MFRQRRMGVFVMGFSKMSIAESIPHTVHAPFFHSRHFGFAPLATDCCSAAGAYRGSVCAKLRPSMDELPHPCLACANPASTAQNNNSGTQSKRRLLTKLPHFVRNPKKQLEHLDREPPQTEWIPLELIVSDVRRGHGEILHQHPFCRLHHEWRAAQIKFHFRQAGVLL